MITLQYLCRFVEEQVRGEQKKRDSSRFVYQFADQNPYVGHPNPLKEGQDLFRRGLLSEAVLALEAEVMKNPDNAEGWRLLGITHAENDDDRQVRFHFYSYKFSPLRGLLNFCIGTNISAPWLSKTCCQIECFLLLWVQQRAAGASKH